MDPSVTTLYRPVSIFELALIFDLDAQAFPPRLPEQPIFYPVLTHAYALSITRDWNAPSKDCGYSGYVTEFDVDRTFLQRYPIQTVGGRELQEYWVPAEELVEFNQKISGPIRVTDAFFADSYTGFIPDKFGLKGRTATEQLEAFAKSFHYSGMDFFCEIGANRKAVYLNLPYWASRDFQPSGVSNSDRDRVISAIREYWSAHWPTVPLYAGNGAEAKGSK